MAKLIKERLKPISLARGELANRERETTPAEKSQLRAALGGLNWVQREVRPVASGP